MLRRPKTTVFWVGRLPHWEVEDGRYFITLHVAGAIPSRGRTRLKALGDQLRKVKNRQSPRWLTLRRTVFREMESWLDRAAWNPHFRRPEVAKMVMEAIDHRQQLGAWRMFEYVVMPMHLHLFGEMGAAGLKETLEDFKRWTGHEAARLLEAGEERFWQREWFDHWSRSDEEDERIVNYIRHNPVKASLVENYLEWPYGSWRK